MLYWPIFLQKYGLKYSESQHFMKTLNLIHLLMGMAMRCLLGNIRFFGKRWYAQCSPHLLLTNFQVTRRYIVRVCKLWHYLALPFLYQRVLLGRSRVIRPLLAAVEESLARHGDEDTNTPFPMLVRRLDVRMRDNVSDMDEDPVVNLLAVAQLVTRLPNLERITIAPSIDVFRHGLRVGISRILSSCPTALKSFYVADTDFQYSSNGQQSDQWRDFFRDFYLSHPHVDAISNKMEFATNGLYFPDVRTLYYYSQAGHWFQEFLQLDFPAFCNAIYDTNPVTYLRDSPIVRIDVDFFHKFGPQLRLLQLHITEDVSRVMIFDLFKAIKDCCPDLRTLELVVSGRRFWEPSHGCPRLELPLNVVIVRFRYGKPPSTMSARAMMATLPEFLSSSPAMKVFQFTKESNVASLAGFKKVRFAEALLGLVDSGITVLDQKGHALTRGEINQLRPVSTAAQIGP